MRGEDVRACLVACFRLLRVPGCSAYHVNGMAVLSHVILQRSKAQLIAIAYHHASNRLWILFVASHDSVFAFYILTADIATTD